MKKSSSSSDSQHTDSTLKGNDPKLVNFRTELDKVFKGIRILFEPFKTLTLNILPSFIVFFTLIEWLSAAIAFLLYVFAYVLNGLNFLVRTLFFRFTALTILFLFFFIYGATFLLSRTLNTPDFHRHLSDFIQERYGYVLHIDGDIALQPFPMPHLVLNGVRIAQFDMQEHPLPLQSVHMTQMIFYTSWFSLFLGRLVVTSVKLSGMTVAFQMPDSPTMAFDMTSLPWWDDAPKLTHSLFSVADILSFVSLPTSASSTTTSSSWFLMYLQRLVFDPSTVFIRQGRLTIGRADGSEAFSIYGFSMDHTRQRDSYTFTGRFVLWDKSWVYDGTRTPDSGGWAYTILMAGDTHGLKRDAATLTGRIADGVLSGAYSLRPMDAFFLAQSLGFSSDSPDAKALSSYGGIIDFSASYEGIVFPSLVLYGEDYRLEAQGLWLPHLIHRPFMLSLVSLSPSLLDSWQSRALYPLNHTPARFVDSYAFALDSLFTPLFRYTPIASFVLRLSLPMGDGHLALDAFSLPNAPLVIPSFLFSRPNGFALYGDATFSFKEPILTGNLTVQLYPDDLFFFFPATPLPLTLYNLADGKSIALQARLLFKGAQLSFFGLTGSWGSYVLTHGSLVHDFFDGGGRTTLSLALPLLSIPSFMQALRLDGDGFWDTTLPFFDFTPQQTFAFKISADRGDYRGFSLRQIVLEGTMRSSGLQVSRFSAQPLNGGAINATFLYDRLADKTYTASFTFQRAVIDLAHVRAFFFNQYPLIGRIILDGTVRIDGKSLPTLWSSARGNLSFQSESRTLAKKTNVPGFYLHVSPSFRQNRQVGYVIQDVYGILTIGDGMMPIFPATLTLDRLPVDYRGGARGYVDFSTFGIYLPMTLQRVPSGQSMRYLMEGPLMHPTLKPDTSVDTERLPPFISQPLEKPRPQRPIKQTEPY